MEAQLGEDLLPSLLVRLLAGFNALCGLLDRRPLSVLVMCASSKVISNMEAGFPQNE